MKAMSTKAADKAAQPVTSAKPVAPTFRNAFLFWLKLGFISFGGPTGQIAIMHQELVERRKWISNARFLHALNYCMLLPGPEAQQLATYVGWLLHRTVGGVVAGSLFVLPSVFILWGLSYVYVVYGNVPWIAAIFYGLKPAVLVLFPEAGKVDVFAVVVAVAAFALMLKWKLDVIPVVVGAGVLGLLYKLLL